MYDRDTVRLELLALEEGVPQAEAAEVSQVAVRRWDAC